LWKSELGAVADLCCISRASFLWIPFQYEWFGLLMGIVLPTAVAVLLGTLLFRRRIAGAFVSIITLAFVLMVRLLVIEEQPITNGFNGLTDLALLTIGNFQFDPYDRATYYLVALSLVMTLVATRLLVETRAGLILQGIRDDQSRARYLGFNVPAYQTFFFSVSAAIAGLAGMLYVVVSQFASPTFLNIAFSITMVVWAAVGGRGSLLGACVGAIVINMIEATASETEALLDVWRVIVGLGFVLAVLFLPRGIAGLGSAIGDRIFAKLSGARKDELVASSAMHAAE
jgi:urea transport system permease protein